MINSDNIADKLDLIRLTGDSSCLLFEAAENLDGMCFSSENWSANAFREEAANDNGIVICAMNGDRIAGLICGYYAADQADIATVAVDPGYRRQGIGDMLIESFEAALPEAVRSVFLEVRESNLPAIKLYEKHGFERVGVRKNYYSDPVENAVIMTAEI